MFRQQNQTPQNQAGMPATQAGYARLFDVIFEKAGHQISLTPKEQLCPKGLCVLLGEFGSSSRAISDWARKVGTTLMVIGDQPLPMEWLRQYAPHLDFMLVDADYMDDTESTIDFCMQVRRATPNLPLILLSSEVQGHDLTCERMMACDVTLKNPVQGQALTQGVQAAYQNNAYFTSDRR